MKETSSIHSAEYVKEFFDSVAERYDDYKKRHGYYHNMIANVYLSSIPPGSTVIDFGCGTGELLGKLNPRSGCGIDFSPKMISAGRARLGDNVRLLCEEFGSCCPGERYDYAVISNTLEYVYDINALLLKACGLLNEDGKIVITTVNPVWKPLLRLASGLRIRTPDIEKNFLTNKDVVNLLETSGFEIIEEALTGAVPLSIPFVAPVINFIIRELPLVRQLGIIQYVIAKKKRSPREYACSIIVPCRNEAGNIKNIIREAPKLGLGSEVIFVDDGSDDGTAGEVDAGMRDDIEIKLISYKPYRGKSYAVNAGFENAKGEILFILDADLSVGAQDLKKFYMVISEGYADFVNGTRFIYPMEGRAMKIANYFGNKIFCLLVSWITKQRVSDTLCGTKALFRKDFKHISMGSDPWGDYDLIFGAAQLRLKTREVPIHYKERKSGKSKMRAFGHAIFLLKASFRGLRKMKVPLVSMVPEPFR